MKIKSGVIMQGLKLVMNIALREADKIWDKHGQELTITSALDGEHSAGSLHYYGYALDFRIRYFDEPTRIKVYHELRIKLTDFGFNVILHKTHIHVEYQKALDDIYFALNYTKD